MNVQGRPGEVAVIDGDAGAVTELGLAEVS
jgi:hypothetical protein